MNRDENESSSTMEEYSPKYETQESSDDPVLDQKKKSIQLMCSEFKGRKERRNQTTSSYVISNTIDIPNIKLLIKSVASLIHISIKNDCDISAPIDRNSDMWHFSEEKYILEYPELFDEDRIELLSSEPTVSDISEFIEVS